MKKGKKLVDNLGIRLYQQKKGSQGNTIGRTRKRKEKKWYMRLMDVPKGFQRRRVSLLTRDHSRRGRTRGKKLSKRAHRRWRRPTNDTDK